MLVTAGRAAGIFVATNVDDIVLLALWFGRAAGVRGAVPRILLGQYLGFAAILAVSVAGALGAGLLPPQYLGYLGLVPLLLGLRAGWQVWRDRRATEDTDDEGPAPVGVPSVLSVAAVTLANGGDNIGVYVPVLATASPADLAVSCGVFLVLVAVWCALGRFLATRPPVARLLGRWGHVLLPVVLVAIGVLVLVEGL